MPSLQIQSLLGLLPVFIAQVSAHGYITSPQARIPGDSLGSICGTQILNNQAADTYGNIQGELQMIDSTFDPSVCNLWFCKGFQFGDQPAENIQSYSAGETVPIHFDIRAPHDGTANVSIVDAATNTVISTLKTWDQYALTSRSIQADETDFDIVIPSDLPTACGTAGGCVIQMFWDARSVDQTYESCIDFVVGGSGSGGEGAGVTSSAAAVTTTTAAYVTSPSSSSAAVEISTSVTTVVKPVDTTTMASSAAASTTETATLPETSAASTSAEMFTLTAGSTTMLCQEEL